MEISIKKYGHIISDKQIGDDLLEEIRNGLKTSKHVVLDFTEIKSMATFCSKQVFGRLYLDLKPENFYERIEFKNVNEDVKLLIKIGIQNALDENP
jgi:hypothetical protein